MHADPAERPEYLPSKSQLRWPNGARTLTFSSEEPDRLRGPQHDKLCCDELMAWSQPQSALDMARFGLRTGLKPQMICTTTPKPSKLLRQLCNDPTTIWRSREPLCSPTLDSGVELYTEKGPRKHLRFVHFLFSMAFKVLRRQRLEEVVGYATQRTKASPDCAPNWAMPWSRAGSIG